MGGHVADRDVGDEAEPAHDAARTCRRLQRRADDKRAASLPTAAAGVRRRVRHRDACAAAISNFRSKASIADDLRDTFSDTRGQGRVARSARHHGAAWNAGPRRRGRHSCEAVREPRRGRPDDLSVRSLADFLLLLRTPRRLRAGHSRGTVRPPRPDHRLRRQHRQRVARRASPALHDFSTDTRATSGGRASPSTLTPFSNNAS